MPLVYELICKNALMNYCQICGKNLKRKGRTNVFVCPDRHFEMTVQDPEFDVNEYLGIEPEDIPEVKDKIPREDNDWDIPIPFRLDGESQWSWLTRLYATCPDYNAEAVAERRRRLEARLAERGETLITR